MFLHSHVKYNEPNVRVQKYIKRNCKYLTMNLHLLSFEYVGSESKDIYCTKVDMYDLAFGALLRWPAENNQHSSSVTMLVLFQ